MNELIEKIKKIKDEMNSYFLERREEIDILWTAILSKKHIYLLGEPGTGKSMLCRAIAQHIEGARYFDWLLTKFTTPDEIFGPPDISSIEEGKYRRVIDGKLPTVHIAFLDEVFKANSSILNALLKILNERLFDNDTQPIEVPLISLFTSSNELPSEDENLSALYDRLHLRKIVTQITDIENERKLLKLNDKYEPKTKITLDEIYTLHKIVKKVDIDYIIDDAIKIFRTLKDKGIFISNRRKKESMDIIRAYTLLNGKTKADTDDLEILQYVLWNEPQEVQNVASTVLQISNPFEEKAKEIMAMLDDLEKRIEQYTELNPEVFEIYQKLLTIDKDVKNLLETAERIQKNTKSLREVRDRIKNMIKAMRKDFWGFEEGE